jgi:hypothetical protein
MMRGFGCFCYYTCIFNVFVVMDEGLRGVFTALKCVLSEFNGFFTVRKDSSTEFELWSVKEFSVGKRRKKDIFFAALILQKNYVGLYFMPVYTHPSLRDDLGKDLLSNMSGKSCFHFTKADKRVLNQVRSALKKGLSLYQKLGWA